MVIRRFRRPVASVAAALILSACTGIASPADAVTKKSTSCNLLTKAKAAQLLGSGTVALGLRDHPRPLALFSVCRWTRPGEPPYSTTPQGLHFFDYFNISVLRARTAPLARAAFNTATATRMDCVSVSDHAIAGYPAQTSVCHHPAQKKAGDGPIVDDPDYPEFYSEAVIVLKGNTVLSVGQDTSAHEAAVISQAVMAFIIRRA